MGFVVIYNNAIYNGIDWYIYIYVTYIYIWNPNGIKCGFMGLIMGLIMGCYIL